MSYKTNPIANRLKLTKGWKFSSFPTTKKKYNTDILLAIKIYLVFKAYLHTKQIKLVNCEVRRLENNTKLVILNIHRSKTRKIRRKKKSLTKRDVRIKLTRIKYKKALNIIYNNLSGLKKLSPLRFSPFNKHLFQKKWAVNNELFKIFLGFNKKKKKQLDFIKYKRLSNRKSFFLKRNDFINKSTNLNWVKPTYFLQKKYKALINQAVYYKTVADSYEKFLKIKKNVFLKKVLKEKTNVESYLLFLKKMQESITNTHIKAAGLFSEAAVLSYRIKEECNSIIFRKSKFVFSCENFFFSGRKKKINYILKNAKKTLVLLKKSQKYRTFYKKDLLKLVVLKKFSKNKKLKKKYYQDVYNTSIRSSHLNYHVNALEYTTNKTLRPSDTKKVFSLLKNVNLLKKTKDLKSFLKLTLFLRKMVIKNVPIHKKKKESLRKNKKVKHFIKKATIKFLIKKRKKKLTIKTKTLLDVVKNFNKKKTKSFNKKEYLKYLNTTTKFKLSLLFSKLLSEYLNINTIVKVVNFVDTYKNMKTKRKVYSKFNKKKNKLKSFFKKTQRYGGRLFNIKKKSQAKNKLLKPIKNLIKKQKLTHKNIKVVLKDKKLEKIFKTTIKRAYIQKLKTIFKKKNNKIKLPSLWEKSEEDIFRRIQQIRAENIKKNHFLARFIPVLMVFNKTLNAQILADQVAFEFEKTKNHWPLISSIKSSISIVRFKKLKGFRIGISGKINGSSRTRTVFISKGNLPIQSFSERMNFATSQARARTGTFGIRVWLYF